MRRWTWNGVARQIVMRGILGALALWMVTGLVAAQEVAPAAGTAVAAAESGGGTALATAREEIRRAFIQRDYSRVVRLTEQLRQQYPNVNHQSYYLSMSQIKLAEREAQNARRSSFRRLTDAPGAIDKDSPTLSPEAEGTSVTTAVPATAVAPELPAATPTAEATPAAAEATPTPAETPQVVNEAAGQMIPVGTPAAEATPSPTPTETPAAPAEPQTPAAATEAAVTAAQPTATPAERQIALATTPPPAASVPVVTSLPPAPAEEGGGRFSLKPSLWIALVVAVVAIISLAAFMLRRRQDAVPEGPEWEAEQAADATGVADEPRLQALARQGAAAGRVAADADEEEIPAGDFDPDPFGAPVASPAAVASTDNLTEPQLAGDIDDDLFTSPAAAAAAAPTAEVASPPAAMAAADDFFASLGEAPALDAAPALASPAIAAAPSAAPATDALFDIFAVPEADPFTAPAAPVAPAPPADDEAIDLSDMETVQAPQADDPLTLPEIHLEGFDAAPAAAAQPAGSEAPPVTHDEVISFDALDPGSVGPRFQMPTEDAISLDAFGGPDEPASAEEPATPASLAAVDLPGWGADLPATHIEEPRPAPLASEVAHTSAAQELQAPSDLEPEEAETQTVFPRRDEERLSPLQGKPSEDTVTSWQDRSFEQTQAPAQEDGPLASADGDAEVKAFHPDETVGLNLGRGDDDEPEGGDTLNSLFSQSGFHARPDVEVSLPPQFDLPQMESAPAPPPVQQAPPPVAEETALPEILPEPEVAPEEDMGSDLFDREYRQGLSDAEQGNWASAVHHLSIAAALRPDVAAVKDRLREARRMKNA